MNVRFPRVDEAEKLVSELWLPLAREMESISDYNKLSQDLDKNSLVEYRKDKIEDKSSITLVAEAQNQLVGIIAGSVKERSEVFVWGKYCNIDELFIKKEFRKKGIATELLDQLIDELPKHVEIIELNVNKNNPAAKNLYEKNGFETEKYKMIRKL